MIYSDIPERALSIQQPWAWLIVNGLKDIENRDWKTNYRGPVAIHAGKKMDDSALTSVVRNYHPVTGARMIFDRSDRKGTETGGIVGIAEIVDCVDSSESDWFVGKYGFVIRNARPVVPYIPVSGALGFFDWRKRL